MKVLIADQFEQSGIDAIEAAGCEVVYEPSLADQQLRNALATMSPDVLIVRSTKVTGVTCPGTNGIGWDKLCRNLPRMTSARTSCW